MRKKKPTHCKRGHPLTRANTYRPKCRPHERRCRACAVQHTLAYRKSFSTPLPPVDETWTTGRSAVTVYGASARRARWNRSRTIPPRTVIKVVGRSTTFVEIVWIVYTQIPPFSKTQIPYDYKTRLRMHASSFKYTSGIRPLNHARAARPADGSVEQPTLNHEAAAPGARGSVLTEGGPHDQTDSTQ